MTCENNIQTLTKHLPKVKDFHLDKSNYHKLRHLIANYYFVLGYMEFDQYDFKQARLHFLGALRYNKKQFKSLFYLLSTFLGKHIVASIKSLKR